MESRKRTHSTNNNDYPVHKKVKEDLLDQSDSIQELGCSILSSSTSSSPQEAEPEIGPFDDYQSEIANAFEETENPVFVALNDFTYKIQGRNSKSRAGRNPFSNLPDEIILKILGYFSRPELVTAGLTCRRFGELAKDRNFWQRINLSRRKLDIDNIGHVLLSGVTILRLNSTIFPNPAFSSSLLQKLESFTSSVRLLDLSDAYISCSDLRRLLSKMRLLEKLSLESVEVDEGVVEEVCQNRQLTTLNLAMATGLNAKCVELIVTKLTKLKSLNLGWTRLDETAASLVCFSVSPDLTELDLSGCQFTLRNEYIVKLVERCRQIRMLDLSDCLLLSVSTLREIIQKLPLLESLAISRCCQIQAKYLVELEKLPNLKTLSVFDVNRCDELWEIQSRLPAVYINQSPFSVIARPTVGMRRTSIWKEPTS
ncbi:s-phase kinase-associated protein [Nesidiocoris tenuis]|uniref:S-phase kinase-associated protein n=1 Tax=Nesidiocoris tenuis TaxID=355587 RepID=A0ABN7AC58_9HEMI|nr:s-phase kinase-associated protein [Nesidiocoris tenuis]